VVYYLREKIGFEDGMIFSFQIERRQVGTALLDLKRPDIPGRKLVYC
jgi:hypothetical protein